MNANAKNKGIKLHLKSLSKLLDEQVWVRSVFSFLILVFTVPSFAQTKQDTNREIVRTYAQAYLEANDSLSAERAITEYITQDDQDPVLWNYLGLSQMSQKKYEQACYAFQKASQVAKSIQSQEVSAYEYSLADCFLRSGNINNARVTLRVIQARVDEGENSATRALVALQENQVTPQTGLPTYQKASRSRFRLSGTFGVGYDSNVILLDDATVSLQPNIKTGSWWLNPGLQLGYTGSLFQQRLDSRMITTYTNYLESAAKNYNLFFERSDHMLGDYAFRYGVFQELAFLAPGSFDLFFVSGGASFQKRKLVEPTIEWLFELPVRYRYFKADELRSTDDRLGGVQISFKGQYQRVFKDQSRWLSQAVLSANLMQGKNYRSLGLRLPQYFETFLPGFSHLNLKNTFSFELEGQTYFQSVTKRNDLIIHPGAGVYTVVGQGLRLGLDYSFQMNRSSLSTAKYKKSMVALTAMYNFL